MLKSSSSSYMCKLGELQAITVTKRVEEQVSLLLFRIGFLEHFFQPKSTSKVPLFIHSIELMLPALNNNAEDDKIS